MSRSKPETRNLVSEDVAQIMLINVKERRRLLLAGAAIAIALLLVTIGPTSPGSFVGVSAVSGEGARTPAATNKVPVVAGKSSPALKTPWGEPDLQARNILRQFQLALLQPTSACKEQLPGCAGGKYGPVSPRRNETPSMYLSGGGGGLINRADGPEDRSLSERCLGGTLPDFGGFNGGFSRIVQASDEVSILYDLGGQNRHREIPITTAPHLPASVRQWWGDSRGHWDGNTLVVDVTNFSPKFDFQGAHENLHLVERWTRLDADTIEYVVTIDDPTTWTKPWTVKQELKKQSNAANRIYYEPRCHEGNYGLAGLLRGARVAERTFAEGRGPDPATLCITFNGCGGFVRGGFADEGPDADPFADPAR